MDEYLEAFVREGEEHVTDLNNALLTLESTPENEDAMDQIFRTAHTLKGNFGAMGFEDASDLAHVVEDLLDGMRQGDIEVTSERMDHIFAGIDEIEACLEDIETNGAVHRDVRPTIDDLRTVLAESEVEGDESDRTGEERDRTDDEGDRQDEERDRTDDEGDRQDEERDRTDDEGDRQDEERERTGDERDGNGETAVEPAELFDTDTLAAVDETLFHVRVDMSDSEMPGVDAMFVLEDVTTDFDVVDTVPSTDAIEDGEYEGSFDLAVATGQADVGETIASYGNVSDTTATPIELDERIQSESDADARAQRPDDGAKKRGKSIGDIQSVRVDVDKLDELHGLVEQLVTTRIKLRRSVEGENRRAEDELDELDKITSNLQDTVMDMRLVPMKKIVGKFPRLVRDLAREEDKQIDFEIVGDDVEIDRTILSEISDPLMHLLRNAVDHGIELPVDREAADKDPTGTITLEAERERDRVNITVSDDGRGIDHDVIRRKAVEKGIYSKSEVEELSDPEAAELIFHPGFSTNEEITDVSGRGVGMDVVHDTVTRLDGSVAVETEPGEGTTITLTLPVTVAIVKVLFVESGDEEYGIPIKSVEEIGRMRTVKRVDGEEVVTYGDSVFPLIRLGDALNVPGETKNGTGMLVKVRESERTVAIHCDEVRGQEEVVVKPFEGILSGIPGLSGAAVLGEGDVVTILDVATL